MRAFLLTTLGVLTAAWPQVSAFAHPGGLNSEGCHRVRKTGEYHCHRPSPDDPAAPKVKKSRSGICHDQTSPYYHQVTRYETFETVQACLDSGGRLPKG